MLAGSVRQRGGDGYPPAYGPGRTGYPAAIAHGYAPEPRPITAPEFRLLLTGNPLSDPRPRGPWVTGPAGYTIPPSEPAPVSVPYWRGTLYAAGTGLRMTGGQGTDLGDPSTWQRQYLFTPRPAYGPVGS